MELKNLALPESLLNQRIERVAGVRCVPLDGAVQEKGTVAVVVRDCENVLEKALDAGVPVVVVVGKMDQKGKEICRETQKAGILPECLLFVEKGNVVDGRGNVVVPAVSGCGIGIRAVVQVATKAAREELYPEPVLWTAGEDVFVRESGGNLNREEFDESEHGHGEEDEGYEIEFS